MENIREGGEGCYVTEVNKLQFRRYIINKML